MNTVCIRLNYTVDNDSLPILNRETLHISNCPLKEKGWFCIQTTAPITVDFKFCAGAESVRYYGNSFSNANYSEITLEVFQIPLDTIGEHCFYIPGTFVMEVTFSDITKITKFDATAASFENTLLDDVTFQGLLLDCDDLMKLSLVSFLGLRYSLTNLSEDVVLDMTPFTHLTHLYLGTHSGTSEKINSILLSDDTMGQLQTLNTNIRKLPANLIELGNCSNLYIQENALWDYLPSEFEEREIEQDVLTLSVESNSENDFVKILNFIYNQFISQNNSSIASITLPDFTISSNFLQEQNNVDKIYAICGICDNVKSGNSVVAKEGANKIKIGSEVYPK